MGFTQVTFLFVFMPVFILIYLAAYKLSGKNVRICNGVLVLESLLLYWWAEPKLLLFFISLSFLMFVLGIGIHSSSSDEEKTTLMIFGVFVFSFLPVIYRYLPTIKLVTNEQPVIMPMFAAMLVPVGIAFFVLGAISYILDIYMGKVQPSSLTDSILYAMFFPKAICGPVVLWRDFSPQIRNRVISLNKISEGIKRIIIGYAKKAIIADTFAAQIALIDTKMSTNSIDSATVWIMGLLYLFRIYYDFSGYSDISIGLCKTFGFDIGENFDKPYISGSITEFWRRWHISLGRWFKEYIYIPLGGNRTGNLYINLFVTFLVAAAWHGWKLNLLLWGALNALIVIAEKAVDRKGRETKLPVWLKTTFTMLLVCFGWMLFRAADMTSAAAMFRALFVPVGGTSPNFTWHFFMTKKTGVFLIVAVIGAFGLFQKAGSLIKSRINPTAYEISEKTMLLILFAVDIMFIIGTSYIPFIYTQIP